MALKIAQNGNSSGISDPNYLHFKDEQAGILLPPAPFYPTWLPQLQLTLNGRLCFWNFPAALAKTIISNPANAGTVNFLRDMKAATTANPYPPVPAPIMYTNGKGNQYIWNSCSILVKTTQALKDFLNAMEAIREYVNGNGTIPIATLQSQVASAENADFITNPKVGTWYQWGLWDMIGMQIQWYLDKFMNRPYDLKEPLTNGKTWIQQFNVASQGGNLSDWLGACNFFAQNPADPSTWDKVTDVLPTAILSVVGGILAVATVGAASPLLVSAMKAVSPALNKQNAADQQAAAQAAYDSAASGLNTANISAATSGGETLGLSNETLFIIIAAIIILIGIFLIFKKSK